jgi:hypothetical protein
MPSHPGSGFPCSESCLSLACCGNEDTWTDLLPYLRVTLPTLIDARAILRGLSKQRVDLIVRLAEPRAERRAVTDVWRVAAQALPEILCAVPARVQRRQRVQQLQHMRALCGARALGVIRSRCVQERPCCVSEGIRVGRAVCALRRYFGGGSGGCCRDGCCHGRERGRGSVVVGAGVIN